MRENIVLRVLVYLLKPGEETPGCITGEHDIHFSYAALWLCIDRMYLSQGYFG